MPTKELLTDRGMMGEGVIDIGVILRMVEATGHDALVEVEIFSAGDCWTRDPDEVLATLVRRSPEVC